MKKTISFLGLILLIFSGSLGQSSKNYSTAWFDPEVKAKTYCNPINIDYTFEYYNNNSKANCFRSTADPLIVPFKGDYFLFCSNQSGFYWSKDLSEWNFVYSGFQRLPDEDDQCAPAAVVIGDTLFYMGSTYESLPIWYSTNPKSGRWMHLVDSTKLPAWDPALFLDDDGKLYLYYGSSGTLPVKGVEIDQKTFSPIGDQQDYKDIYSAHDVMEKQKAAGSIKELVGLKPSIHGWERFGMNNDDPAAPWGNFIEGAWMTKHQGKYYLQYGAPGTEFKVYADGVWVSDSALGPFVYQKHNPFSYKPGGFIMGSGHGGTFVDFYGNIWHVSTCMISVKYKFERRIGLYPAGFDNDGVLYSISSFGDYPTLIPNAKSDNKNGLFSGWMLLSYKKQTSASSIDPTYNSTYASDEDIRTYWSAKTSKKGEWLQMDLGRIMSVNALQINYADHNAIQYGKAMDLYHQYKIFHSEDGEKWSLLVDKTYNDKDIPHDYVELTKPVETRFLKLENIHMATGNFAISDFRVFGNGLGKVPENVKDFKVLRSNSDPRNAMLKWSPVEGAYGYNIYFGVEPDKMYNCITVNGANEYDFRGMDKGTKYYFTIEALSENGISEKLEIIGVK